MDDSIWPNFLKDRILPLTDDKQVEQVDIWNAGGLYIRQINIRYARIALRQHIHPLDHITFLIRGAISVVQGNEKPIILNTVPSGIIIKANIAHTICTLVDYTSFLCIHNLFDPASAATLAEHGLKLTDL